VALSLLAAHLSGLIVVRAYQKQHRLSPSVTSCNDPIEMTISKCYRFGLFEFDVASRELRREGLLIRLQSQPAQVLACLIGRSGQVVSREELCDAVWGSETSVDFERGLNFCIAQVRSALGDDSVTPRFVRTIPKRGYQFIAPVERMPILVADQSVTAQGRLEKGFLKSTGWKTIALSCAVLTTVAACAGYWFQSSQSSNQSPIVAIVRFDNETGDPGVDQFSDGLTDSLVEQLTSQSRQRYRIIGNAMILRLPREQRDLGAIAASLHARYVVLGQVQRSGSQTRILAHLIRLPDQTHLWVDRMDRTRADSLGVESEAAQKIGTDFSQLIVKDSAGSALPPFPNN
jgi:DNA-binding winged helix-turn-helix (wHTH) protein/TolB-like protein